MIDIDDPRTAKIAEAISNDSAKKILSALAENELSESELTSKLGMAANTVNYNIKNLEECGLIEKARGFMWSVKGKKVFKYQVVNKKIIISPKMKLKGVVPTILVTGLAALLIKLFVGRTNAVQTADYSTVAYKSAESAGMLADAPSSAANALMQQGVYETLSNASNTWAWFFLGGLVGLLVFLLWTWRDKY